MGDSVTAGIDCAGRYRCFFFSFKNRKKKSRTTGAGFENPGPERS